MKKKLMMVAVLLGALSLGACVDDNESASVTAVREAKAKQLESIAAMNNAEAEAKLIYAQAEAQLKAAEAALQQALADKVAAEAKITLKVANSGPDTPENRTVCAADVYTDMVRKATNGEVELVFYHASKIAFSLSMGSP